MLVIPRPKYLLIHSEGKINLTFNSEVVERLDNSTYMYDQSSGVYGFTVHLPGDQEVKKYKTLQLSYACNYIHLFDGLGICNTS